jgi:hypothetical protein
MDPLGLKEFKGIIAMDFGPIPIWQYRLSGQPIPLQRTSVTLQNMNEQKFLLNSDQLELLLAFEICGSIAHLAKQQLRDPSVISRQLAKISEIFPVIRKKDGRWKLTDLGMQINVCTRESLAAQRKVLGQTEKELGQPTNLFAKDLECTALVLIGVQMGFEDPSWGARNQVNADQNIESLMQKSP